MKVNNRLTIEKMLTIDETGMPKAPSLRQLQDKDVSLLWSRDTTQDKRKYISEAGVIYYMADPKSPVRERGLSDKECLKEAIENYNLPKDYVIDALVARLIGRYYNENITEAGLTIENLQRSVHLSSIAATRINEILSNKLANPMAEEDIPNILALIDRVNKTIVQLPDMTKALASAYDNLRNESETETGRGGQSIQGSMDADEN